MRRKAFYVLEPIEQFGMSGDDERWANEKVGRCHWAALAIAPQSVMQLLPRHGVQSEIRLIQRK